MPDPISSNVDHLAELEARFIALVAPARAGHPDNIRDFQADIATPSAARLLREALSREVRRLQADRQNPDGWARLERVEALAMKVSVMAFMAQLPTADAFSAIMQDAQAARRTMRPDGYDPKCDLVTSVMDSRGNVIHLPTRPGPFSIGGPGADVVIPGEVGVQAIGRRYPDGQVGITKMSELRAGVGRNEPCPCGSGRKFKRCCDQPPN